MNHSGPNGWCVPYRASNSPWTGGSAGDWGFCSSSCGADVYHSALHYVDLAVMTEKACHEEDLLIDGGEELCVVGRVYSKDYDRYV